MNNYDDMSSFASEKKPSKDISRGERIALRYLYFMIGFTVISCLIWWFAPQHINQAYRTLVLWIIETVKETLGWLVGIGFLVFFVYCLLKQIICKIRGTKYR